MKTIRRTLLLSCCLVAAAGAAPAVAQDDVQTFNAFAPVTASGTIVRTAEKKAMVVGTLAGPFFVETDEGPQPAGRVGCAVSARTDQESLRLTASGACSFTAHDGATAWGEWECAGYQLVGCRGTFKLAGGTARLAGAIGESTLIWRPTAHEFTRQLDGTTLDNATGVLLWRDFKLTAKK